MFYLKNRFENGFDTCPIIPSTFHAFNFTDVKLKAIRKCVIYCRITVTIKKILSLTQAQCKTHLGLTYCLLPLWLTSQTASPQLSDIWLWTGVKKNWVLYNTRAAEPCWERPRCFTSRDYTTSFLNCKHVESSELKEVIERRRGGHLWSRIL